MTPLAEVSLDKMGKNKSNELNVVQCNRVQVAFRQ